MIEIEGTQERNIYKEAFEMIHLASSKGNLEPYISSKGGEVRLIMYAALGVIASNHTYEDFMQSIQAAL